MSDWWRTHLAVPSEQEQAVLTADVANQGTWMSRTYKQPLPPACKAGSAKGLLRVLAYHQGMAKKSDLVRQLEASIKMAKAGKFRKHRRDSLGDYLRKQDGEDMPDSLADPDEFPLHPPDDDADY